MALQRLLEAVRAGCRWRRGAEGVDQDQGLDAGRAGRRWPAAGGGCGRLQVEAVGEGQGLLGDRGEAVGGK